MKKLIAAAGIGAAVALGSLAGAGTASAAGSPSVCDAIDAAPTYQSYLIDAAVWGYAFNWDTNAQSYNIASAVNAYCPWHLPGLRAAAASLS